MRKIQHIFLLSFLLLAIASGASGQQRKKVLVFSKTMRYYHESIPALTSAIQELGRQHQFDVDTTKNSDYFTEETLKQYAAVIFLSTGGDVLDTSQQADFERYIQAGGGYVGIHAASTTEYSWPWYGRLVGAFFNGHPEPQNGTVKVVDAKNISTAHLPRIWKRHDEWYNFKEMTNGLQVLLTVDESTYKGGQHGSYHPIAWYHPFDGGRSFYTALGHFDRAATEPLFLQHILGGIKYAIGTNVKLNYSKAKSKRVFLSR